MSFLLTLLSFILIQTPQVPASAQAGATGSIQGTHVRALASSSVTAAVTMIPSTDN